MPDARDAMRFKRFEPKMEVPDVERGRGGISLLLVFGSGGTGFLVMILSTPVASPSAPLGAGASGRAGDGSLIAEASVGSPSPGPSDVEGGRKVDPELDNIG